MTKPLHTLLRRLLLPKEFDVRHGEEMGEVFQETLKGFTGFHFRVAAWAQEARDLFMTGRRLRTTHGQSSAGSLALRNGWGTTRDKTMGLLDDLRYAARSLVRSPGFTLLVVLTGAVGVGATTAIYSAFDRVLLNPVPYDNADRMVTLHRSADDRANVLFTPSTEQIEVWSRWDDLFETVELMAARELTLGGRGSPTPLKAGLIRPSFHTFAGRPPVLGRPFTGDEMNSGARSVLLGYEFWVRHFAGETGVLGQTLELDGEPWTIVGIMPPHTPIIAFQTVAVDLWLPLPPEARAAATAVLRHDQSIESANARLATPLELESGKTVQGGVRSLVKSMGSSMAETLRILMAAVGAILLIAGVNISNLLINRASQRRGETAMRSAMGGGRGRIMRQMVIEGLLLGLVGGMIGVALAFGGLEMILRLRPESLSVLDGTQLNRRVLVFSAAVAAGSSLFFSLIPAWRATLPEALAPPRDGTSHSSLNPAGSRIQWFLVSGEVALTFALLVGSVLLLGSLERMQRTDPGFQATDVIALTLSLPQWQYESPAEWTPVLSEIHDRLSALPGIQSVARASGPPPNAGIYFGKVQAEGGELSEESYVFSSVFAGSGYFRTMGQPLLRGREFTGIGELRQPRRCHPRRRHSPRIFRQHRYCRQTV